MTPHITFGEAPSLLPLSTLISAALRFHIETLELLISWKAMSPGPLKTFGTPSDARRSQRVLLRIPILVRAQFAEDQPIKEDTTTLEVNAHGGLIALAMKVRPGQKLVLKNWATAIEQECRVVHVMEKPFGKNDVGIAFPFAMPKFWNVEFPPPDWKPYIV